MFVTAVKYVEDPSHTRDQGRDHNWKLLISSPLSVKVVLLKHVHVYLLVIPVMKGMTAFSMLFHSFMAMVLAILLLLVVFFAFFIFPCMNLFSSLLDQLKVTYYT